MTQKMDQKKLMNELKQGELQPLYLLYGEERFLVSHYAKAIETAVFGEENNGNHYKDVFDGPVPVHDIIMTAQTLPFFSDRRLIFVRDSRLFVTGRKDDSERMTKYLDKAPEKTMEKTTIVFIESEVDRRSKLFKQMSKIGAVLDCTTPMPQHLATWVIRQAKTHGKGMSPAVAQHLLRTVGTNMAIIYQEMDKLAAFCGPRADILPADIEAICTPTLESRIFDLIKAMGSGRVSGALAMYRDMLVLKESPIMILSMIIRQFRHILLCKCCKEKGLTIMQTETKLGLRDFMVLEALGQGARFTVSELLTALEDCMETDVKIKTGLLPPEFGVELLIIKYSSFGDGAE